MITSISSRTLNLVLGSSLAAAVLIAAAGCQQEAFSSNPALRSQGVEAMTEGNYADAAGSFRAALRSDPRDYHSQYYLGQCYEQMKQYQQAIQAYKASLDAQTRSLAGQEDQAQRQQTITSLAAVISKADNGGAETNAVEQAAKSGNQVQDWVLLAKICANRGDADSAIDAYNRAYVINPKDFTVVKAYGLYLAQLGQKQRAEQTLRKAYALNSNDEQVNEALRRLNIVPGPGLKAQSQLVKPPLPNGALPDVDLSKFRQGSSSEQPAATATPAPTPTPQPAATPQPPPAAPPVEPPPSASAPRD